ncbi:MAG: hypothetical protein SPI25_02515 [Dialister sp.]|nr:hypothetical protein [Dialister sp.]
MAKKNKLKSMTALKGDARPDQVSHTDFIDHSIHYSPYMIVMALLFLLWAAYVGWTSYWGIMRGYVPFVDIGLQVLILWYLTDILRTRTTYTLRDDGLLLVKQGLTKRKELLIPYDDIFGVHHFKNQLMKPVTYRYTFHWYSKLDNRPIWSLLYDIGSEQKVGRVLMKAAEPFWKKFEQRLPGQIRITQEEVVAFTYKAMEKKLRERGYFKEHPEMDFEEGIQQLRQKGTEMGGAEEELTSADFDGEGHSYEDAPKHKREVSKNTEK